MGKIKVGIIGTGNISAFHIGGYKALPELCEVVAVCDIDEQKVKKYAANHGVARYYTDYNEMMAKEKLDAVSVCTWNAAHKGAAIAALRGGANVICEKPMAMNAEEAEDMQKVAEETGKLLMVAFVRRFGNDADILKNFIEKGSMGDIYYAKATYLRRNGCPGGWFGDKEFSGGGPLIDLGVHVIDLVRYLAGGPKPVSVYGVTYSNLGNNRAVGGQSWVSSTAGFQFKYTVEDFASALVRFDNGMTLAVEASFNLNIKNDMGDIELFGTKAGAKIDPQIEFFSDMNGMLVDIKPHGDTALNFNGLFNREMAHFVDCVCNSIPCRSVANDGVVIMKILDAIYKSAETGSEVKINL
ncbi:MAG: oxidoreductase [Clostridiales bacterium GWF2_38_85]|nr:MAG: oxidoreductase [Clostridiales bacterium GWF2_38_85]HBL83392.1 oxidoreductase [Clostridiales bacterium]